MTKRRKAVVDAMSKRERQVMEILYRRGEATAGEVFDDLPDAASYNAVRSTLTILEEKGHLRHETRDRRYVYRPTIEPTKARGSLLSHLVSTLFSGSPSQLVSTLIDEGRPSDDELERLEHLIREARATRKGGRK